MIQPFLTRLPLHNYCSPTFTKRIFLYIIFIYIYKFIIIIKYKNHTIEYERTDSTHLFCITYHRLGLWGDGVKWVCIIVIWRHFLSSHRDFCVCVSESCDIWWSWSELRELKLQKDADVEKNGKYGLSENITNINTSRSRRQSATGDENITIILVPLTCLTQQHASRY